MYVFGGSQSWANLIGQARSYQPEHNIHNHKTWWKIIYRPTLTTPIFTAISEKSHWQAKKHVQFF